MEALFIEINLRKNNFLLVGTYHSTHPEYGTRDLTFLNTLDFVWIYTTTMKHFC